MSLTPRQVVTDELTQLGLKPGANASQINAAIKSHFAGAGLPPTIDTRTGLPYTQATAKDAGSGNLVGLIIGGGVLGEAAGLAFGVTSAAEAAAGGGAAADAGAGGAEAAGAGGGAAAAEGAGAGTAVKAAGLAGLLGLSGGVGELLVRVLECLAGAALILLGLEALTGGSGNPATAVKSVAKRGAVAAAV